MNNKELEEMGKEIRIQGGKEAGEMTELVFNNDTCEFEIKPQGSRTTDSETNVTAMSRDGFAFATEPIVYADMEELKQFFNSSATFVEGKAYEWEGEGVIHLHTAPITHAFGKVQTAVFYKGKAPTDTPNTYVVEVDDDDGSMKASLSYINDHGTRTPLEMKFIPSENDLHSRNKGILETDVLEEKHVLIIGLGSFGSYIAVELAKAGVGHISGFDPDRVELHNLARHTASVKDLGRLKTDVMEEAIKGKNPYAIVDKFPVDINDQLDLLAEEMAKADIVICCTDNNPSRFNVQTKLIEQHKIGIFGRAVTRAEGGDVFIYRPGGPCYCCLIGNQWFAQTREEITNVESARQNGQIAAYVSPEDADAMVQVGLSADIEPICNMMVKLALMELSRGHESGITCLEDELVYDYYLWANRRERRHKNWAPMPNAGHQPTIMRWYGVRVNKNENCSLCSAQEVKLDVGEDLMKEFDYYVNTHQSET